jgi:hypothetical protein
VSFHGAEESVARHCSARPDDLLRCANEAEHVASALRGCLAAFDRAMEYFVFRTHGLFAALRWSDPLWSVVNDLEDLSSWVAGIGSAFEAAGGRGAAGRVDVVTSDAATIDAWSGRSSWRPVSALEHGTRSAWAAAVFGPRCISWDDAGYEGAGFIVGPDRRAYPLVAPHVVRHGRVYNADDGTEPGRPSVLDLDGRDPGWRTVYEQIGVERWRDDPGAVGRLLTGIGSSAAGPPVGSTASDVDAVLIAPGRAPVLSRAIAPTTRPDHAPPIYAPPAPPVPPPNAPDLEYPVGQASVAAGAMNLAPVVLDGIVGAARADLGSHDAYDIVLQANNDGRIRALYRRVFVGFDRSDEPELSSVYVTGPERNDQVRINYAPR